MNKPRTFNFEYNILNGYEAQICLKKLKALHCVFKNQTNERFNRIIATSNIYIVRNQNGACLANV
jgi:hypothetical protein